MGTRSPSWAPGLIDRRATASSKDRFRRAHVQGTTNNIPLARGVETRRASLKLKEESPASAKEVEAGRRPDHRELSATQLRFLSSGCRSSPALPVLRQPGLPIGLQIVGAPFAESTVLAAAHACERETEMAKGIRSSIWPKALQIRPGWSANRKEFCFTLALKWGPRFHAKGRPSPHRLLYSRRS